MMAVTRWGMLMVSLIEEERDGKRVPPLTTRRRHPPSR
jgi:hypothetical protein